MYDNIYEKNISYCYIFLYKFLIEYYHIYLVLKCKIKHST